MTPKEKAEEYLRLFDNDVNSCIKMCDLMIEKNIRIEYFELVKIEINKELLKIEINKIK